MSLRADDAQALYDHLKDHGVPILIDPFDTPFGRTFVFQDPDGYALANTEPHPSQQTGHPQRATEPNRSHMASAGDRRRAPETRVHAAGSSAAGPPGAAAYWALLGPDITLCRTPYDAHAAAERLRPSAWPGNEAFIHIQRHPHSRRRTRHLPADPCVNMRISSTGRTGPHGEDGTALTSRKTRWLALICAGVIAAAIGVTAWPVNRSPVVNQAQARAMLPVINAYLDKEAAGSLGGFLTDSFPHLKARGFCDARIIEIRPDGPRWRVGMVINCGEFTRRGNTLLEGSAGYPGIGEVMTLSDHRGRYQVLSLQVGPPYADHAWVDRNFSSGGAARVFSDNPLTAPDPIRQAWRAFGFPAGTPPSRTEHYAGAPTARLSASWRLYSLE
jgi:hypothetical protein